MTTGSANPNSKGLVLFCFVVLYFLWGSTFLAISIAVQTIPPLLVGACRHFLGGLILFLILAALSKIAFEKTAWRNALLVGVMTAGIANGSLIVSEKNVPSAIAAITFTTMPILMLLFNWIGFEKVVPRRVDLTAIPLGVFGTYLVIAGGTSFQGTSLARSDIALLIACPLFWSLGSLIGRRVKMPRSILLSSALQMMGGGLFLLLLGTVLGNWKDLDGVSSASLWGVIYLTLIGSLLGYSAFAYLIKNVDPRLVGTYALVNPIIAVVIGYFWGERIMTPEIIGGAMLTFLSVGLLIASQFVRRPRKSLGTTTS